MSASGGSQRPSQGSDSEWVSGCRGKGVLLQRVVALILHWGVGSEGSAFCFHFFYPLAHGGDDR